MMEEKSRFYGGFLTWEQENEIERYVKEMEENGTEKRAIEYARKWLRDHPEEQKGVDLSSKL